MIRSNSVVRLALAVLIVLGLADQAAAQQQVPFLGRLEGSVARTPLTPPFVLDTFTTTGTATQLGQYKLVILATVNLTTRTATGTYVLVAANGDRVAAQFNGQSMPTASPGVILLVETATVTGGTGRFVGASGSFICKRLFSPVTGRTIGSFAGTISSPGAGIP